VTHTPLPVCEGRGPPRGARGFSLIEVVVSSTLLLIGLAGTMSALSSYQKGVEHQRHLTQGIHIAESTMEQILLATPTDPMLAAGTHGPRSFNDVGHLVASGGKYNAYWIVTPNEPIGGMRKLDVRVEWMEGPNGRNVVFTTHRR
jgi:prepilin-type N-terminal cleavage/methylation domain-containing protein